jgi:benzylsuccinate CoA-transferase BbsF subunit
VTRRLPLEGVRVADLSWIIAGPYGTYLLARMGAEVIKIEGLTVMDHTRQNPPYADGVPGLNRSGFFNSLNAAKKSVALQLDEPEHARIAREIIASSDAVVESFSYGTMERLGLGQRGRDRDLRAFMGTVHAHVGLNSTNGYRGGPPKAAGGVWADYVTGSALVFALLAALRHRARTGCGQHIDLAMADGVVATMAASFVDYFMNGRVAQPQGNESAYACPQNAYRCRGDDAWVAVSVETEEQWTALCRVVVDPVLDRPEYREPGARRKDAAVIDARITAWTKGRTPLEATEALQKAGVPAGPSSNAGDLMTQPQLKARGFFVAPDHPEIGRRPIPGLPWRFSRWPDVPCPRAPFLGEHNDEIAGGLLGEPRAAVDALNARRDEVVRAKG